jgi:hypothetical protein
MLQYIIFDVALHSFAMLQYLYSDVAEHSSHIFAMLHFEVFCAFGTGLRWGTKDRGVVDAIIFRYVPI